MYLLDMVTILLHKMCLCVVSNQLIDFEDSSKNKGNRET